MTDRAIYAPGSKAHEMDAFFDGVYAEATKSGTVLDSVSTVASDAVKRGSIPSRLDKAMGQFKGEKPEMLIDAVMLGMDSYKRQHGVLPTGDVLDAAVQQAYAAGKDLKELGIFDNVSTSTNHNALSLQPNRMVVAVTAAIAEAIPFATYLPTDIGSNEARLGIASHLAGSSFGDYQQNDIIDGVNVGNAYLSSERVIELSSNGGTDLSGKFVATAGGAGLPLLPRRTIVNVNGLPCAYESESTPSSVTASPLSGVVRVSGIDHTISGTVNWSTGEVTVKSSPSLPANTVVTIEAFIDYEKSGSNLLAPEVITQIQTFKLYATPWRGRSRQSIDANTQAQNELGLDLVSESLMAIRNQAAAERHFNVLRKAKVLAASNAHLFDFAAATQLAQKTRAQVLQDLQSILGKADQQMANETMDHGITHLYVDEIMASMFLSLPDTLFQPSGITARPGIYRVGRLFNKYEVYYEPKVLTRNATASQILCIGRSQQVARCPFVLGDAVPTTILPLAMGDDLRNGNALYGRNFTSVNPHAPSARGVAMINVINLF